MESVSIWRWNKMMNYVNLKCIQAAGERMQRQILQLRERKELLRDIEKRLELMSYTDAARQSLVRSMEVLDENIRILTCMRQCLGEVCRVYRKTEAAICDRYYLDTVLYPETHFATSYITGMEEYQSVLLF